MLLFWITGQEALLVNELFILGVTVVVVTKDNNSPRSRDTSRYLSLGGFVLCALHADPQRCVASPFSGRAV